MYLLVLGSFRLMRTPTSFPVWGLVARLQAGRSRAKEVLFVYGIVAVQAPIPDSITPFSLQRFVDNTQ